MSLIEKKTDNFKGPQENYKKRWEFQIIPIAISKVHNHPT